MRNWVMVLGMSMVLLQAACSDADKSGSADAVAPIDIELADISQPEDVAPDVGVACPDEPTSPEGDPCTVCACDADGVLVCAAKQAGDACQHGDCCAAAASCMPCVGEDCPDSGLTCEASGTQDCDDNTVCTVDSAACQEGVCQCIHEPAANGIACVADPHACTVGDQCQDGLCQAGEAADLDDGNPCTSGLCVKGLVEQKPLTGPCNDGDACTMGDECILGQCVPDALVECPEAPCASASYCDSNVGECVVQFVADGTPCDSEAACVTDATCQEGQCVGDGITDCDDGDPCTVDYCDEEAGNCTSSPALEGTSCSLEGLCVEASACNAVGLCIVTEEKPCDDGDPCTADSCDDGKGCVHEFVEGCGEVPDGACSDLSVRFDGNSCIFVPGLLAANGQELTIEFWIRVDAYADTGFSAVIDKFLDAKLKDPGLRLSFNNSGPWAKRMHYQETYPAFKPNGEKSGKAHGQLCQEDFMEEQWRHYAVVRTPDGKAKVFLDGKLHQSPNWNEFYEDIANPEDLWIGCQDGSGWFLEGRVDELRISSVVRYDKEGFDVVDTVFQPDAHTVALYRFEEGEGDTVLDASGNGYHGTWLGTGGWAEAPPQILCQE